MEAQTIALTFSEEMELSFLNLISDKISKDISNIRIQSLHESATAPETRTVSVAAEWAAAPIEQKAESAAAPVSEPGLVFSSAPQSLIDSAAEIPASGSAADPADTAGPVIESITGYDAKDPSSVTVNVVVSDPGSGVAGTYYTVNGGSWTAFTGSFTLSENCQFMVKAEDTAGNQTWSNVLSVTGIGNVDHDGPTIDSITGYDAVSPDQVTVNVTVSDTGSGVAHTYYAFNGTKWTEFTGSFTVSENGPFRVKAVDNAGNETRSRVLYVKNITGGDVNPPVFADYAGDAAFDLNGNGTLFWSAATDDRGEISKYDIQIFDASDNLVAQLESTVNSVDVSGLPAGGYSYQVVAYDPAGNSTVSPRTGFSVRNWVPTQEGGIVQVYENGDPIITQMTPLYNYTLDGNIHQMQVFSAGKAVGTTIQNTALATLQAGGAMEGTIVTGGGHLVGSGGNAVNTTLGDGGLLVLADGIADVNTIAGAGAGVEVNGNGIMNNTDLQAGNMILKNGGEAIATRVNSGTLLFVSSGGTANAVTVLQGGTVAFERGAFGNSVEFGDGTQIFVSNGAHINNLNPTGTNYLLQIGIDSTTNVRLNSNGTAYAISNGLMSSAAAYAGTYLEVANGGCVRNLRTSGYVEPYGGGAGGVMQLSSGGRGYNVENHMSGQINVFSGAYLSGAVTDTEGEIYLGRPWEGNLGGEAADVTVNSNGYIWVFENGSASNVTFHEAGRGQVSSGGVLNGGHISSGGHLIVVENGRATDSEIFSGGIMEVCGGAVSGVTLNTGGLLTFSNGYQDVHGNYHEVSSGAISGAQIKANALLEASLGGSAYQVAVSSGGSARVTNAGLIADSEIQDGGSFFAEGGEFKNVSFKDGSHLVIYASANGYDLAISSGADFVFFTSPTSIVNGTCGGYSFSQQNGVLDGLHFYTGNLNIDNTMSVTNLTGHGGYVILNPGNTLSAGQIVDTCALLVYSAATASNVEISNGGQADFNAGSIGQQITVGASSWLRTSGENVMIHGLTVNNGGGVLTQAGTAVENLVVNAGGLVGLAAGTRAVNVTIANDGRVDGNAGAVITGDINFDASANFYVGGATVEFDLQGKHAGQSGYRLNHIDRVMGEASYVVTVTSNQELGQYRLASYASSYSVSNVTLQIVNGTTLNLAFGSSVTYNGNRYSLFLTDSDLMFSISQIASSNLPQLMPESDWDAAVLEPMSECNVFGADRETDLFSQFDNSLSDDALSAYADYENLFNAGSDETYRRTGIGLLS